MQNTAFNPTRVIQGDPKTEHLQQNYGRILNVKVNITRMPHLLAFVRDKIVRQKKFTILTPNSEIILEAQNDPDLMKILNSSDISLLDSVGVLMALKFLKEPFGPVIKGRKAFIELTRLANKKGWKVFLLGGEKGVAQDASYKLSLIFKKVMFETSEGPRLDNDAEPVSEVDRKIYKDIVKKINDFNPQLLFVGFGAPKQEKWIHRNIRHLNVGGAMVVGGAFDYVSGRAKVPPVWIEDFGLEWLWRLIRQPWRLNRVLNGAIVFPLRVFLSSLKLKR